MYSCFKHISIFLAACAALVSCDLNWSEQTSDGMMHDGLWEGTGEGRGGTILVRSKVSGNQLESITVVSQAESSFAQDCIYTIIGKALGKQDKLDIEVDGVSGATLTSTGIIDAINMSIDMSMGKAVKKETRYKDGSCDVVVIGGGGAGLSAAIEASSKGAKVIVLEKMGILGGNTNYSTGGINAAETSTQAALGINDSKEAFFNDTYNGGHQIGDKTLIQSFVDHAAATIDWLKSLGADLSDVGMMAGSSVKRTHRPKGGTAIGPHLMKTLKAKIADEGIEVRLQSTVKSLKGDKKGVTGVVVENKDGSTYEIKARAVIIATGGFGANLSMVSGYRPELAGFSTLNHKGATGDAFAWLDKVGGSTVQMDQIQIHPTSDAKNHIMITEAVRGNGAILVNAAGERFVNEMQTRDVVSAAILSQPGGVAYLVFDQAVRESLASIETYACQGILTQEESLGALASSLGIQGPSLEQSMQRYNDGQRNCSDADFGRLPDEMPRALEKQPFYAICVTPAIHHTMGGIHVDAQMHALTSDNKIIPGLYAAGEVTGGLHGGNRLGGNGVADVVVNGKIAGATAAEDLK